MRTDIPAFFSTWFVNRLTEGFVLVRSPYNPQLVTKYIISLSIFWQRFLRNFPEASSVALNDPVTLAKEFVRIGKKFDIRIQSCAEGKHLASYGVDISGCMEPASDG